VRDLMAVPARVSVVPADNEDAVSDIPGFPAAAEIGGWLERGAPDDAIPDHPLTPIAVMRLVQQELAVEGIPEPHHESARPGSSGASAPDAPPLPLPGQSGSRGHNVGIATAGAIVAAISFTGVLIVEDIQSRRSGAYVSAKGRVR
jgi:hypothetical protein